MILFEPTLPTVMSVVGAVSFFRAKTNSRTLEEVVHALRAHFRIQAAALALHAVSVVMRVRSQMLPAFRDAIGAGSDAAVANACEDAVKGISLGIAALAVTLCAAVLPLIPFLTSLREFVTTHRLDLAARDAARDAAPHAK
jgi:hypothetical protein